jgi:hypothetical protein
VCVFFRREVVLGNQLWGDGGFGHGKSLVLGNVFFLEQFLLRLNQIQLLKIRK